MLQNYDNRVEARTQTLIATAPTISKLRPSKNTQIYVGAWTMNLT